MENKSINTKLFSNFILGSPYGLFGFTSFFMTVNIFFFDVLTKFLQPTKGYKFIFNFLLLVDRMPDFN
jgi:hypothetical protein